jgi:hypothetical protein
MIKESEDITQQASSLEASDQWEVNINKITQQASSLEVNDQWEVNINKI